jgi:hypothetical protein
MMTAPRRVRPGLGFPDAVIIRSTGGPSAPVATRDLADFDQHDQHDDEEQQHPHQLQPDAEGIRPGPHVSSPPGPSSQMGLLRRLGRMEHQSLASRSRQSHPSADIRLFPNAV